MSVESSQIIKRQWHIIRYLLDGQYVATSNIKDHLAELDIHVELRMIQRDLLTLEKIFPLECRRDSMPHSWRWKRLPETSVKGLNLSQALTLRLVEEQLQDVMPARLIQELQPLFEKAKMVTGMIHDLPEIERDAFHSYNKHPKDGRTRGLMDRHPSPFDMLIGEMSALITSALHNPEKERLKKSKAALSETIQLLQSEDLGELAVELKRLN